MLCFCLDQSVFDKLGIWIGRIPSNYGQLCCLVLKMRTVRKNVILPQETKRWALQTISTQDPLWDRWKGGFRACFKSYTWVHFPLLKMDWRGSQSLKSRREPRVLLLVETKSPRCIQSWRLKGHFTANLESLFTKYAFVPFQRTLDLG